MDREGWNARYRSRPLVWSAQPNRLLAEEVADLPRGRALDLGCGEGRNALWLARQGWQVTAIDFSEVAIEKARALAREQGLEVDWRVADIGALEPGAPGFDAAFDLVLVLFLHTDPDARARWLELARRALAPGGTFIYIGHDRSNIEHGHGGPGDPEVLATPEEIARSLPGLVIERAEVVRRPIEGETGHGPAEVPAGTVALDTLVRARRP